MSTKDIEEIVEEIRVEMMRMQSNYDMEETPDYYDDELCDIITRKLTTLTQHHEAEVKRAVEDICRNHLETLEDALNDPDLYGAINGMVHSLRTFLTQTTPDNQPDV